MYMYTMQEAAKSEAPIPSSAPADNQVSHIITGVNLKCRNPLHAAFFTFVKYNVFQAQN